jgi:hypothetical protein
MWQLLVAAVLVCDPPNLEVRIRVVDPHGAVVPGAEVRQWSGAEPVGALLGVTDASGLLTHCFSPRRNQVGIYRSGFQPKKVKPRAGQVEVRLAALGSAPTTNTVQQPPCVTGSTTDGAYRLCEDVLTRLPLQLLLPH